MEGSYPLTLCQEDRRTKGANPPILRLPREAYLPNPQCPTFIVQEIACYLPTDVDLYNLMKSSVYFSESIAPANSGVWRARFLNFFDHPPSHVKSLELKYEYQFRSLIFSEPGCFRDGEGPWEKLWLNCLITLLKESYNKPLRPNRGAGFSRNIPFIEQQALKSDILSTRTLYFGTPQYTVVNLALTYFVLRIDTLGPASVKDYCVEQVYQPRVLVSGGVVDLEHSLQIRNFWWQHLTRPEENSYHLSYEQLGADMRPASWGLKIDPPKRLGNHWLGYYSCLHPFEFGMRETCADGDSHWAFVPVLALRIVTLPAATHPWPRLFSTRYPENHRVQAIARSYFHGEQFVYNSSSPSHHTLRGFTEDCAAQGGLPGWRRICFIIFRCRCNPPPHMVLENNGATGEEPDSASPEPQWEPESWDVDFHWAYGYQGIVTPGGKVMLGGWVDMLNPMEGASCGPFIFWEVGSLRV